MFITHTRPALAALTTAALGTVPVPAAAAEGPTRAVCTAEAVIEQSHGLTLQPSASRFRSVEPGPFTCRGTIAGREVGGPGTFTFVGSTDDTWCVGGSGQADGEVSIPDTQGRKMKDKFHVTWRRAGLLGMNHGTMQRAGAAVHGPFEAQPLDGDCRTTPVRRVHLRFQLLLAG